ncbi:hypothetical protein LWI28_021886 [Acer negundo]|uniref:Uncharacterized protein n=1 Tax=Acer negundo TaxID=4023 RepID=A0AAD5NQN5_ACENE|nr:hypothetical protein LWI28_021886 [Acer negundo]
MGNDSKSKLESEPKSFGTETGIRTGIKTVNGTGTGTGTGTVTETGIGIGTETETGQEPEPMQLDYGLSDGDSRMVTSLL